MSDDTPNFPQDPYTTQEPRMIAVPKPTVPSLMLTQMEDTALEVAHLSNKLDAFTAWLIEVVTSSKWLLKVVVVSLLLNTLLLIGLLVTVSFLFGALR